MLSLVEECHNHTGTQAGEPGKERAEPYFLLPNFHYHSPLSKPIRKHTKSEDTLLWVIQSATEHKISRNALPSTWSHYFLSHWSLLCIVHFLQITRFLVTTSQVWKTSLKNNGLTPPLHTSVSLPD